MYTNLFWKKYKKNINSSQGEDGIIEELLKRLKLDTNGWVCEFGAWDGVKCSNTFELIKNKNFKGVYIEGDKNKYQSLLKTASQFKNIVPINSYVSHIEDEKKLDSILSKTDIPLDFDILSIDIDSYDYQVWKSMEKYKPKIVIIEINSSVMTNNTNHIHEPGKYQGTGFRPTLNLGICKGYKFLLHSGNMFFVKEELFSQLGFEYKDELENFRTDWGAR